MSVQSQYDWTNIAPSMAVIDVLASLEDVKPVNLPTKLNGTLYDYIDPEALDALVTDDRSARISFSISDYDVQIDGNKLKICFE